MIEQKISKQAATPVAAKSVAKTAKPHPIWTMELQGEYGPRAFLTNSNGDAPVVLVRVNGRGVKLWIGNPPWGCGDHGMEFAGATLASDAVKIYADNLIALLRDKATAKRQEVWDRQDRRGSRR